jgi:hypothetical protein
VVAKLALVVAAMAAVLVAAVAASYRFFARKERHAHEKEMLRERRDAELLGDDRSYLDRELERESE